MSILDQVKKTQIQEGVSNFNPVETLEVLFSGLTDKEKDIVRRRFGLVNDKRETLEEIGRHYGITRERVRQIENLSIKKLKELEELKSEIKEAENVVTRLLEQYGGVMEEEFFLENILNYLEHSEDNNSVLLFLAEHIFSDNVNKIKPDKEFNSLWKTGSSDVDLLKAIVTEMINIIEKNGEPISLDSLLDSFKKSDFYENNKERILSAVEFLDVTDEDINKILESYLRSSRIVQRDLFDNWGLASWGTVKPKKINDKIYLVLKKAGKPLHFTDIAAGINETKFDEKIAYPATVHNELILDDKYVLVGRGIYALKEWGYKVGTVADVIYDIVKENGPMDKDEIIRAVLDKRKVKKSTVYLSLMNHSQLTKNSDGKYVVGEEESAPEEDNQA